MTFEYPTDPFVPANKPPATSTFRKFPSRSRARLEKPSPRLFLRAGRGGERATQERGPLSPRRTGDADFPRPALLETLASGMHIKPEIRFLLGLLAQLLSQLRNLLRQSR